MHPASTSKHPSHSLELIMVKGVGPQHYTTVLHRAHVVVPTNVDGLIDAVIAVCRQGGWVRNLGCITKSTSVVHQRPVSMQVADCNCTHN